MSEDFWEKRLMDSEWFFFHTAANVIAERLGVSGGVAEKMLRELCASGDIRSKQAVNTDDRGWRDEILKPSEWSKDQMDIEWLRRDDVLAEKLSEEDPEDGPIGVLVNGDDFRYWLNKQSVLEVNCSFTISRTAAKPKRGKVPLIIDHLTRMFPPEKFPDGVPDYAHCPRKELKADLGAKDKRLAGLDEGTLKSAVDQFNLLIRNDPK
jgi:hypothetical protein